MTDVFPCNSIDGQKKQQFLEHMKSEGITPEQVFQMFAEQGYSPPDFGSLSLATQLEPRSHSCFISFSYKDGEFARYLHSRLLEANINVWFSIEDVRSGEKLYDQIESAIEEYDKTLIVLSESSLQSEWVMTEIRKAREVEIREERSKLFPITLVNFESIRRWKCFDADTGKDLAVEVREYPIPDFSNWKDQEVFENEFNRLLIGLMAKP
jgi:hypothetical protein